MTQGISLIVGLGNPGPEYAQTRHNAGFRFLEALLAPGRATLRAEPKFTAKIEKLAFGSKRVWLLQPLTYMNHSGDAVAKFAHYYKIPPPEIFTAYDEIDLPPGIIRLKIGGGSAGHNGMSDVTEKLGSADCVRLRIGVGHPGDSSQVMSYVLKKPAPAEDTLIDAAIAAAVSHIDDIVHGRFEKVMNALHAK